MKITAEYPTGTRALMRAAWGSARSAMQVTFERRMNYVTGCLAVAARAIVLTALWGALYLANPGVHPSWDVTVAYTIIGVALVAISSPQGLVGGMENRVRSGAISYDVRRPIGMLGLKLAEGVGVSIARLPQFAIAVLAMLALGLWQPIGPLLTLAGALAGVVGIANILVMNQLIGLLAFWFLDLRGVRSIYYLVVRIASGSLIPFWFMPVTVASLLTYLPFAGQAYLPGAILTGQLAQWGIPLAVQVGWVVVMSFTAHQVARAAVRKLVVQGG